MATRLPTPEIIAMRQAAQALGAWNLADCTLAVTP